MSQLSDALLIAYLDGQLHETQSTHVAGQMHRDHALRARLEKFQHTQACLIAAFAPFSRVRQAPEMAPPAREKTPRGKPQTKPGLQAASPVRGAPGYRTAGARGARRNARPSFSPGRLIIMAFVLGITLAVGYRAVQHMRSKPAPLLPKINAQISAAPANWATDIGRLQTHFVPDSIAVSPESQENPDLVRFQLGKIAGHPVRVPDFSAKGLRFRRGQVLSYRASQLMQLSYMSADQKLIGLYIMQGGPSSQAIFTALGDIGLVRWSRDGVRFVLVGQLPETALRALAALAQSQINPK